MRIAIKNFKKVIMAGAFVSLLAVPLLGWFDSVQALTQEQQKEAICAGTGGITDSGTGNCATGAIEPGVSETIRNVGNILVFITGAIAVLMVIIGGMRYALSGGDQSNTKAAKDTILYALIGVLISIIAWSLVNFVIVNFFD